jgi:hypothetical protein
VNLSVAKHSLACQSRRWPDVDHLPAAALTLGFPQVAHISLTQGRPDKRSERLRNHDRHRTAPMLAEQAGNQHSNAL